MHTLPQHYPWERTDPKTYSPHQVATMPSEDFRRLTALGVDFRPVIAAHREIMPADRLQYLSDTAEPASDQK